MEQKTKPTERFDVQRRCGEIHTQYGTSEIANYRIQLMCDKIAQDAFNEGRQSVIDNIPDLEWVLVSESQYKAKTPFFDYFIVFFKGFWQVSILGIFNIVENEFATLYEAKQAANEDYKNRIKKVLGL